MVIIDANTTLAKSKNPIDFIRVFRELCPELVNSLLTFFESAFRNCKFNGYSEIPKSNRFLNILCNNQNYSSFAEFTIYYYYYSYNKTLKAHSVRMTVCETGKRILTIF